MTDFCANTGRAAEISGNAARLAIAGAAEKGLHDSDSGGFLTRMLDEQIRQFEKNLEPAFKVAGTAAMLGRSDEAIHFLEESIRRGEDDTLGVRIEPLLQGAARGCALSRHRREHRLHAGKRNPAPEGCAPARAAGACQPPGRPLASAPADLI